MYCVVNIFRWGFVIVFCVVVWRVFILGVIKDLGMFLGMFIG